MAAGLAAAGLACGSPAVAQDAVARELARWAVATADAQGLPFAVVDKRGARLDVYGADGQWRGSSPALLGLTPGDHSVAGVAQRVLTGLTLAERTTPAGRFVSEPGHNLKGEAVVWVDYASAFAIHRLRPSPAHERRAQRLASATPDDNRITLGCVVVPVDFYEAVVAPVLGRSRAVVYVLPESGEAGALMRPD
ncbi:MAG: hypothetical protein KF686_04065 [Ramlibacter sp.]|nr:hypothetical protein [Ramlibacter sp.]